MAKRRLDPPSADQLAAMDAEFRSETPERPGRGAAPIAQVAGEAAQLGSSETPAAKLNRLDADKLRDAVKSGLLIQEIPLDQIKTDDLVRDRTIIDEGELNELIAAITISGLRLPIEVYKDGQGAYQLISGYRRMLAFQSLNKAYDGGYGAIKAIVREPRDMATSFMAMVEENEIRANLSHYERGRIAVLAARQGAFPSTDDAIAKLFIAASKSKRSKVKSFAEVFECLGDVLKFPEDLTERRGLRIAAAIRHGVEDRLRDALEAGQGSSVDAEWGLLEPIIDSVEAAPKPATKMGRPKARPLPAQGNEIKLSSGVKLTCSSDSKGYFIRISGPSVDAETLDAAMQEIAHLFEAP
ncbi:ParB family chromosome partitioning protein [Loktanella ponticola]|uniref:ParB family chromosome partitioning protein n=1 Tax=Yoonia ponticola TaxID=1524255 RepID=A0A7W9BNT2_9RHOB|nr:ParB N-terminal domain-containing protein [Yoonia ponticola]MBB5723906.1 ParB family chromosome partitioning protein [Yoonia ponticola]